MPSVRELKIDQRLTDISQAIVNEDYVFDKLFPVIEVSSRSGRILKHGKDHLRSYVSKRDPGDFTPHRIQFEYAADDTYRISDYDLEEPVRQDEVDMLGSLFDAKAMSTNRLTEAMKVDQDKSIANVLTQTATFASGNSVTLSGSSQFSDVSNSRPEKVIEEAIKTVHKKTAKRINTMVIPFNVFSTLKLHPFFLEKLRISSTYMSDSVLENMIKDFFGIKKLIIAGSLNVTSNKGQTDVTDYVWGKNIILGYISENPGLMTTSFGYTFRLKEVNRVIDTRIEPIIAKTELVRINDSFSTEILNNEAGYLIKDVIA